MKHIFTLIVLVSFNYGAAMAQSKTEASMPAQVVNKTELKRVESAKQTSLSSKMENNKSNAVRTTNIMTQEQFDARREELLKNPKKSTKPAAKKD